MRKLGCKGTLLVWRIQAPLPFQLASSWHLRLGLHTKGPGITANHSRIRLQALKLATYDLGGSTGYSSDFMSQLNMSQGGLESISS